MKIERRFLATDVAPVAVRGGEGDEPAHITGTAAVFHDPKDKGTEFELWPGVKERIKRGAFDKTVKDDDIRGLFNHNPDNVLGRTSADTMALKTTKRGLDYDIEAADTSVANDVRQHIVRKDVTGSSFGFIATVERWIKEDDFEIREIEEAQVFDVGPVTFPAYTATAAGVRSMGDATEARASYDAWKAEQEPEETAGAGDRMRRMRLALAERA